VETDEVGAGGGQGGDGAGDGQGGDAGDGTDVHGASDGAAIVEEAVRNEVMDHRDPKV
jgi:hypothetical protein